MAQQQQSDLRREDDRPARRPSDGGAVSAGEARNFADATAAPDIAAAGSDLMAELVNTTQWMTRRASEFWSESLESTLNMQIEMLKLQQLSWNHAGRLFGFPGAMAQPLASGGQDGLRLGADPDLPHQ
jgi:hypothetical protein